MKDNLNINQIGKLNIEKFLNRVAYFNGYDNSEWEKYGNELVDELKRYIEEELLKARIDELKRLKKIDVFNELYGTDPRPSKLVDIRITYLQNQNQTS